MSGGEGSNDELRLLQFENEEIKTFGDEVYFRGKANMQEKFEVYRNGFTDKNCHYTLLKGDHVIYRYEVLEFVGKGGFSTVIKVLDHKTDMKVVLKIFSSDSRNEAFVNEVNILTYLKTAENRETLPFVIILDSFTFRNHNFIVLEALHNDLAKELHISKYIGFKLETIKSIIQTLLKGLLFMRENGILHGDIKPSNIALVKKNSENVKILDFSISKFIADKTCDIVGTRSYRAPENLLKLPCDSAIDMWALGCTALELYKGASEFRGLNTVDHINRIFDILDEPAKCKERDDYAIHKSKQFIEITSMKEPQIRGFEEVLRGCTDPEFVDFIRKCLMWDPEKRMTPAQGLAHAWISPDRLQGVPKCLQNYTIIKKIYPRSKTEWLYYGLLCVCVVYMCYYNTNKSYKYKFQNL